jgi:prolipoprotein diacylglyceryltransferase
LVEQIRVNALYQWGNFTFTQAELIAVIMMLAGMAGMFYFRRKGKLPATTM